MQINTPLNIPHIYKCSECGSIDIYNPVNNKKVALKCMDCGHKKLTEKAEKEKRKKEIEEKLGKKWNEIKDSNTSTEEQDPYIEF